MVGYSYYKVELYISFIISSLKSSYVKEITRKIIVHITIFKILKKNGGKIKILTRHISCPDIVIIIT